MFTLQDIQNLANSTSFERGKSYFKNGYVRNLKFKNNSFEAKVHGSERYDVSISLDKHGNIESTYCDCPYDYDGDCKHIVAVGLAAIEYMKAKAIELTQTVAYERVEPPAASFDKAYAQASDADKLVYLNQLLQKNIDLQQAFLQFISAKNPQQQATLKQNAIDQIACDVYESLSDLMFNEDTFADYAQDRDYGYHYDENYGEDEMEAMVTEVLEPYQKRIEIYMQEGRLVDAFSTWLGVYEGILAATDPQEDDFGMIGDYVEYNKNIWASMTKNIVAVAQKRPFAAATVKKAVDLLIERHNLLENDPNSDLYYNLKDFESLLIAIVGDVECALYIKEVFQKNNLIDTPTIYVMLHIAQLTKDISYWLQLSKEYAQFDVKITENLLEYFKEHQLINDFKQEANRLYPYHKNDIDKLIISTLSYEDAPILYVKALRHYCLRRKDIELYKRLRPYLDEEERKQIAKGEKGNYLNPFYIQILEVEQRYDKMLKYIDNDSFWGDSRFGSVLEIVARYFPDETFLLIKTQARAALASGQRGRTIYASIASWLAAAKKVPSLEKPVFQFTIALVSEYNRMPALKDEFRSVGLKF